MRTDSGWDFTLYDWAFDAAEKNGIKVFATLFPTKPESSVSGIRFPSTDDELVRIEDYVKAMGSHFGNKPALYVWVLQNEPGWGAGSKVSQSSALSRKMFQKWQADRKFPEYENKYMKADLDDQRFLKDYTTWYLNWISGLLRKYDPNPSRHDHHINPHGLFNTLPEYDFRAYEDFLGSLGASMHASWHFDLFPRDRYNLAVSLTCDLIRHAAGKNPFWITELQGGNVTYSGKVALCPTKEETEQWIWTGVGAGAQGVIFWTLNQRGSDKEAGEWGMIDFFGEPSDRLEAASGVAAALSAHKGFFENSKPELADVTLLYNRESLWMLRLKDPGNKQQIPARTMTSAMMSYIATYDAFAKYGVSPQTESMEKYDWECDPRGRVAIISNMNSFPSETWPKMESFVKRGGKLIVLGISGFFDENMHAIVQTSKPMNKCFGAGVSEYKVCETMFTTQLQNPQISLPAHLWKGILKPSTAQVIGKDENGNVTATRNIYGKGEVVWIPSLVGVGAYLGDDTALSSFLRLETKEAVDNVHFRFPAVVEGVYMRTLQSGSQYMTILVNKNTESKSVELIVPEGLKPEQIYGRGSNKDNLILLPPESTQVYLWQ
ncbi:MAG: beta-galactosidase [Candidatus Cryptobacteroides sp.]